MKHSVIEMTRAVRRRLERVVRSSREKDYARRALAVLHCGRHKAMSPRSRIASERRARRCTDGSRCMRHTARTVFVRKLGDGAIGKRTVKCCRCWKPS